MQETWGLIPGLGRSPGGGNATHSSILAWRISWTEEPGGLQTTGLQRVGHHWAHTQPPSDCERVAPPQQWTPHLWAFSWEPMAVPIRQLRCPIHRWACLTGALRMLWNQNWCGTGAAPRRSGFQNRQTSHMAIFLAVYFKDLQLRLSWSKKLMSAHSDWFLGSSLERGK